MKTSTFNREVTESRKYDLKTITLDKIVVFKLKTTIEHTTLNNTNKKTNTIQGFAVKNRINKFKKGEVDSIEDNHQWKLTQNNFKEEIRKVGWGHRFVDGYDKEYLSGTPYDDLNKDASRVDDIVYFEYSSHMIFDRGKNVLPAAIRFEYIGGNMDNGHYDLDKVKAILKKNKNIKFSYDRWDKENEIQDVPYYNNESGYRKTIDFLWQPTIKEYQTMWDKCIAEGTEYPSTLMHKAIFDLDLLKLRKGGAALFDDFYKSKQYEED